MGISNQATDQIQGDRQALGKYPIGLGLGLGLGITTKPHEYRIIIIK